MLSRNATWMISFALPLLLGSCGGGSSGTNPPPTSASHPAVSAAMDQTKVRYATRPDLVEVAAHHLALVEEFRRVESSTSSMEAFRRLQIATYCYSDEEFEAARFATEAVQADRAYAGELRSVNEKMDVLDVSSNCEVAR